MPRRRPARAWLVSPVAVGAVLLVGAGWLGLTGSAAYAAPSTFPGTPITSGVSEQQPATITPGVHVLAVPVDGDAYVAIPRTIPGSRIWYSLSLLIPSTSSGLPVLSAQAFPVGHDDEPCSTSPELVSDDHDQSALQTGLFSSGTTRACRTASVIEVKISGDGLEAGQLQLVTWEEPPVPDTTTMPQPSSVTWSTEGSPGPSPAPAALTPGTSYADAPVLPDGTWTVHVDPGATALLRVPLTWGQHEQVEVTSTDKPASEEAYTPVAARWLTPLGGVLKDTDYTQGGPDTHTLTLGDPEPAGWVTPTVAWRNNSSAGSYAPASFTGDYWLCIDTPATGAPASGVTLTLTATTVTDYPAKAPVYAATPPDQPSIDGSSAPVETSARIAGPGPGGSGRPWPAVGGLFAGSAVMAGAGVVSLRAGRRRRTPATDAR